MIGREQPSLPVTLAIVGTEREAGGSHELDAVELLQEIEVPEVAPEFTIGDRLQADLLLLAHGTLDGAVLDGLQLLGGEGAGFRLGARFAQLGRTKEAADVVGVKRRADHAASLRRQPCAVRSNV